MAGGRFRNGPADISCTVKAYCAQFAFTQRTSRSAKAHERITALNGIHRVNTYPFYMALRALRLESADDTAEFDVLSNWFYFNI